MTYKAVLGTLLSIFTGGKTGTVKNVEDLLYSRNKRELLLTGGDLDKLLGDTIITPTIVIDNSLRSVSEIDDIIKLHAEMFVAKYTTSLQYLTEINDIELKTSLKLLSTHKETNIFSTLNNIIPSNEEFRMLPIGKTESSSEARDSKGEVEIYNHSFLIEYTKLTKSEKLMDIREAKVRITCKTIVKYASSDELGSLLDATNPAKTSLGEQLSRIYHGLDSFIGDLIFSDKLSKDYKANKLKSENSKANLLDDLTKRSQHGKTILLREGVYGFGAYFNMMIVGDKVEKDIRAKLGRPLEKSKKEYLEDVKSMTVTVVDEEYESIDVHSKTASTTINFKQLKAKGGNSEISELIKYMIQRGI